MLLFHSLGFEVSAARHQSCQEKRTRKRTSPQKVHSAMIKPQRSKRARETPATTMKGFNLSYSSFSRVIQASLTYFVTSVVTAVLLDTLRRSTVELWFGKLFGVMLELPILLNIFWKTSYWSRRHYCIPPTPLHHLVMGLIAFACFFPLEISMYVVAKDMEWGKALAEYKQSFLEDYPANLIGRLGEIMYALIPILQLTIQQ